MANIITGLRIICGLLILVFPAFSGWYYALYITGGISDAADGIAARKLGLESEFGAKLDTAADFVFAISVAVKICSSLNVPLWLMIWILLIIAIKIINIIAGFCRYGRMVTVHSRLNKACGVIIYLIVLFVGGSFAWQARALMLILGCIIATAAAIAESFAVIKKDQQ